MSSEHRSDTQEVLGRYRTHRLEPAHLPPPSVSSRSEEISQNGLHGTASLVLAEGAPWNVWGDSTSRLFNNRSAHLFQIDVRSNATGQLIRWIPDSTRLEINVESEGIPAAPNQEVLLEELVFWAFQEERAVLSGDLVERTRAAGDLRRAYLGTDVEVHLEGLIAFPLSRPTDESDLSELHVASMRLTLAVEVEGEGEQRTLRWLFE